MRRAFLDGALDPWAIGGGALAYGAHLWLHVSLLHTLILTGAAFLAGTASGRRDARRETEKAHR